MIDALKLLPDMKSGDDLFAALSELPDYDDSIRNRSQAERLIALSDLYKFYVPSPMSIEIYSKIYLAVLRSLQKKTTRTAVLQQNENYRGLQRKSYSGIIGGSDSFTIIGTSGIGKSSAIDRSIGLLNANGIIETEKPYRKIIPCVVVQCPFDSSVKGLLLEILRKVDESIGSDYYNKSLKARVTTDMLIGSVSQVAINHIGLLVVDEIQNVVNSKNGRNLVGMLTQLINNSGISICMVGTPECGIFFEQALQLARRSLGLQYSPLQYDEFFSKVCETLFSYQYTRKKVEINEAITAWLYEHSGGIIAVVVSLIHDAQEIAILNGKERLSLETLNMAYKQRLALLHEYIEPTIKKGKQTTSNTNTKFEFNPFENDNIDGVVISIAQIVNDAKRESMDIITLMKKHFPVDEVRV